MTQKSSKYSYEILKLKDFRFYLSFRLFIVLALQIQTVAVSWQVYRLTHDPLSLGLLGLAEVIPAIGLALFAGYFVDRSNRKNVVLLSTCALVGVSLVLAIPNFLAHPLSGSLWVRLIYGAIFFSGVARTFMTPAQFAFFGQMMPREHLVSGSAWGTTSWQVAAAVGPALGGLITGAWGFRVSYVVSFVFLLVAFGLFSQIPRRESPKVLHTENRVESLLLGLRFVFRTPLLLSALSLDLFAVLFGGAVALLPVFADQILRVGPQGLGVLQAAPSVGSLLMSVYMAHYPPREKAGPTLLSAVAGFGVCMVFFALSKSFVFSVCVLGLSGVFDNVSVVVRGTLLQLLTPDNMRGRVSAVNSIFIGSSNEIGAFESGITAKFMGTIPSVIFGGVMTLVVVATTFWRVPRLRTLDLDRLSKGS